MGGKQMTYSIIDTHCDVLLKLWKQPSLKFTHSPYLQANMKRLQQGHVKVQFFAIFVDPDVKQSQKFQVALEQINLFHSHIIATHPLVKHVTKWGEISSLKKEEMGAVL